MAEQIEEIIVEQRGDHDDSKPATTPVDDGKEVNDVVDESQSNAMAAPSTSAETTQSEDEEKKDTDNSAEEPIKEQETEEVSQPSGGSTEAAAAAAPEATKESPAEEAPVTPQEPACDDGRPTEESSNETAEEEKQSAEQAEEAAVGIETQIVKDEAERPPLDQASEKICDAVVEGIMQVNAMAEEILEEKKKEEEAQAPLYVQPPEPVDPQSLVEAIAAAEERLMAVDYDWDQNEKSVNIRINLPENVPARTLEVSIKKDELSVKVQQKPFLQWRLFGAVQVVDDEAQWTVSTGKDGKTKVLDFDLPKEEEGYWHFLVKQRLPESLLLSANEVNSLIEEDLKKTPVPESQEGLVMGQDGIKLNPEVEKMTEEEKSLTAVQLYQNGLSCFRQNSTSFKEGLRLIRLCALHHDHADSCLFLFEVYAGDTFYGIDKDFQKGLWFLRYGADRTQDMRCFVTLANNYEHGLLGLPHSFGLTVKYFQRAAKMGHATAMSHLGDILMQGKCIDIRTEPDEKRKMPEKAKTLLLHAQKRGCPQSYVTMGDCYLRDMPGFERDFDKAAACYEKGKSLFPELRSSIPTHELAMMKKAMEESQRLKGDSKSAKAEDDIPEISTALAQPKGRQEQAFRERVSKLEGQLMKAAAGESSPAPSMDRPLWGGASFWEKVGTIGAVCAIGLWLFSLNKSAPTPGRR